ncbi:MAG TPA: PAS domain-containing sensor histidine kinase [Chryseosolibacter sp.]|nr:PAS domain-containing sensor histidine kinase [Chryseosolibacter sp.]
MQVTDFQYDRFFELTPDLLCIAGYDGFFKKVNPAVATLLGYPMEELYARPINDFVYHEDKDITSRVREELTRSKPLLNFENRYVTSSGEIVWLSWTSLPVESDQLIFAIAKNVTHKKRQEAERNSMLTSLAKINEDLKQLTYTTSHDLRSPVNNILAIFSLIDTSKISDPDTLDVMAILQHAGEKLKQSLNNYIDLLKQKHSLQVPVEELFFQESLDHVLQSISYLIQASRATVHTDFSSVSKIKFNKPYLESIFLNLITNSIKYARPDVAPAISVYSQQVNGVIQLIVSDNGLGFDLEKVKDDIFGLHQKFHDHSDSKGIGLYLVHSHVTNLGGKVHVESKVNEGTKFTISFKEQ